MRASLTFLRPDEMLLLEKIIGCLILSIRCSMDGKKTERKKVAIYLDKSDKKAKLICGLAKIIPEFSRGEGVGELTERLKEEDLLFWRDFNQAESNCFLVPEGISGKVLVDYIVCRVNQVLAFSPGKMFVDLDAEVSITFDGVLARWVGWLRKI